MLWIIPELSDYFMYFNDDMMLISKLEKDDVFDNGLPILNFVSRRPASRRRPEGFARYHYMRNTQKIINRFFEDEPAYLPCHFPMVWSKSLFEFFFENLKEDFLEVIYTQKRGDYRLGFFPGMLHHNWLKATTDATLNFQKIGVFISGDESEDEISQKSEGLEDEKMVFLCVNNLSKTQNEHPDFIDMLRKRVGI